MHPNSASPQHDPTDDVFLPGPAVSRPSLPREPSDALVPELVPPFVSPVPGRAVPDSRFESTLVAPDEHEADAQIAETVTPQDDELTELEAPTPAAAPGAEDLSWLAAIDWGDDEGAAADAAESGTDLESAPAIAAVPEVELRGEPGDEPDIDQAPPAWIAWVTEDAPSDEFSSAIASDDGEPIVEIEDLLEVPVAEADEETVEAVGDLTAIVGFVEPPMEPHLDTDFSGEVIAPFTVYTESWDAAEETADEDEVDAPLEATSDSWTASEVSTSSDEIETPIAAYEPSWDPAVEPVLDGFSDDPVSGTSDSWNPSEAVELNEQIAAATAVPVESGNAVEEKSAQPAPMSLDELADRLERIASSLRKQTLSDILAGATSSDPLEILLAGYALGHASARSRPEDEST